MAKPEDIPQDVWDAAVEATRYRDITLDEAIARAIMAATERERATVERLKGTLRYIHTQAKTRPSGDALTLSVIERNTHAALDDGFQSRIASIKKQANDDFKSIPHGGFVA
jgi:hypothetical protein